MDFFSQGPSTKAADPEVIKAEEDELTKKVSKIVQRVGASAAVHKKTNIHSQSMDDLNSHASSTRSVHPEFADSTSTSTSIMPQPQPPRNSTPAADAVTVLAAPLPPCSLVDFQDRIILLAARARIAGDGKPDMGRLIIDKICTDAIAQRVVEAYHRQNKSAEQAIEGLKNLYMTN